MTRDIELKFESGSLDWTEDELNQLPQHWRDRIEQDIKEEQEHKELLRRVD